MYLKIISIPHELTHIIFKFEGEILYLHGGIARRGDLYPSNKLYKLNLISMIWDEVRTPGSPALSHHACIPLDDRYILLIGGWNGRVRTSAVVAYDTIGGAWLYPEMTGFPEDAGLSSHTASLLRSGSILVLGREGSLRMQPKDKVHGNAYMLTGSVKHGYQYTEYSRSTDSRSGHSTSFIGQTLYVLGGRCDNLIEVHRGYDSGAKTSITVMEKLTQLIKRLKPLPKMPGTRRHHVAFGGSQAIFMHGGEKFEGPNRGSVGEMYIMVDKPNVNFYKLGVSRVCRAGHVCCNVKDMMILHGGLGEGKMIQGDTRVLTVNFEK